MQGGNLRECWWKFLTKLLPKPFFFWIPNGLIGWISPLRHLHLQDVCTMNVSWECCWRQLWAWQWHNTPQRTDSSCHRAISAATHWQLRKIMVMMNKPLSDRGGTSQILPPTLSHKGMTLWCSSVDNWWSVLIRCNMSEASGGDTEKSDKLDGFFFFLLFFYRSLLCGDRLQTGIIKVKQWISLHKMNRQWWWVEFDANNCIAEKSVIMVIIT